MNQELFKEYFKKFNLEKLLGTSDMREFPDEKIIALKEMFELIEKCGAYVPLEWYINDEKKIIYLNNAKVACTSFKSVIMGLEKQKYYESVHQILQKKALYFDLKEEYNDYFKFTYVRNPFERLVSCYQNKYHTDKKLIGIDKEILGTDFFDLYFVRVNYLLGYLDKDQGFESFAKKIVKVPNECADRHFVSQYFMIYKNDKCLVDFVGKIEELPESFKEIQNKYQLEELPIYNKTDKGNWMDYYTLEIAELVYKYYKKDFEVFGYEDEYKKLVKYLKNKDNKEE